MSTEMGMSSVTHHNAHIFFSFLQVIQDALHQFKGTPEEVQVTVANAELAVRRGDLPAAIAELRWALWWSALPSSGMAGSTQCGAMLSGPCTGAHRSQRSNAGDCSTCCLCRAVPRESPFFLRARVVLADIYLTHKHDRAAYARCYSDLVDKHGDFDSYRLYGEALLHIQEPEKAIKVGEAAHPTLCTESKSMP